MLHSKRRFSRPPCGLINIEGRLLSVEKQVAIALRRLASGESQVSIGASFGVGQSTVSQLTRDHLIWPVSARMEKIKSEFNMLSGCQTVAEPSMQPAL